MNKTELKPFAARLETSKGTLKAWLSAGVFSGIDEARSALGISWLRSEGIRVGVKYLEYRQLQAFYGSAAPPVNEIGFWQLKKTPPEPIWEIAGQSFVIFDLKNGSRLRIMELGEETKKLF